MKRLYLLLLGVFVLFISLTSVSYAYTLDDVFLYASQLTDITVNSSAGSNYGNLYSVCYDLLSDKESQVRNLFNQNYSSADSFGVNYSYTSTGISVRIMCYTGDNTYVGHSNQTLSDGTYYDCWVSGGTFLGSINCYKSASGITQRVELQPNTTEHNYSNSLLIGNLPKGFYLVATGDYSSTGYNGFFINGLHQPTQYSFIPYTTETINVVLSNNLSGECIRLPFSPAENYKRVGNIQGWEDLDGFSIYWSPILYVSGDETYGEVASMYTYTKQNGGLSDGHITFMNINDGAVYINADLLYNRQTYVLSISGHIGDDYFPIYLDGHDYDATFYSYFYTTDTSVPSNNTGISQQYYESLPPSLQNFLEDNSTNFNDTQQNNINYLLNDMFTDVFSGDQFGGNLALEMGYSGDILDRNYYSNLIYDFYRKIINTIASDNTTSSITFNIRSKTFVLNSNDFLVPSGPLKTFVTTFLIAGIVYLFYLQIHRIVLSIATLDLYTTIKSFDQKHSVFM